MAIKNNKPTGSNNNNSNAETFCKLQKLANNSFVANTQCFQAILCYSSFVIPSVCLSVCLSLCSIVTRSRRQLKGIEDESQHCFYFLFNIYRMANICFGLKMWPVASGNVVGTKFSLQKVTFTNTFLSENWKDTKYSVWYQIVWLKII